MGLRRTEILWGSLARLALRHALFDGSRFEELHGLEMLLGIPTPRPAAGRPPRVAD
jgi:hypothetical protein